MKKHSILFLSMVALLSISNVTAQVAGYTFNASSGTYTPISGGTDVDDIEVDTDLSADLPIGFNFYFDGNTYTTFRASSNGFISFGTSTSSQTTNDLDGVSTASRPLIAPLWDDLAGSTSSNSQASYIVTGSAPNRVLTFEWLDWEWNYLSSVPVISFQIKLYETTNEIQFIYREEAGAIPSASASIGLTGINDFLSLGGSGSNPGVSSSTETSSINTKPATGQTYTFTPPSCLAVSNLSVSNVTSGSADLAWTDNAGTSQWEVEYGTVGFTQGSGTTISPASNPQNVNTLSSGTNYEFYVRADCGSGDYSNWTGPYTFTTPQVPVSTFPYTEDWESGQGDWQFSNSSATNQWAVGSAINNGGSQSLYVSEDGGTSHSYNNSSNSVVHAYRDFSIPSGNPNIELSFDWLADGEGCCDYMNVFIAPTSFVPVEGDVISTSGSAPTGVIQLGGDFNEQLSFITETFTLDQQYSGQTFRLIFQWDNDGSAGSDPPIAIDNISLEISSCGFPTNLTATNITSTSADLGWTDNAGASQWEVEYGTVGFTQGSGTTISPASNPQNVNSLTPNTDYEFYVRADCGGSYSSWVGPFSFSTPCNVFVAPYLEEFDNASLPNCWNENGDYNWDYGSSNGTTPSGFADYGAENVEDHSGNNGTFIGMDGSYNGNGEVTYLYSPLIDVSGLTTTEVKYYVFSNNTDDGALNKLIVEYDNGSGWVPLDSIQDNLGPDWDERVFYLPSLSGNNIQIRFEVTGDGSGGDTYYHDILIDDFEVKEAPSCPKPTSLYANNITGSSAEIGWTDNSGSGLFDIEVGPAGFTPTGTPTESGINSNPHTLNSLSQVTSYDYYVRSDCGGSDQSLWAGPFTFTTGQTPVSAFPYTQDWESGQGGWEMSNGSESNQWFVGTATNNGGNQALYVSNDGGSTNSYTTYSSSVVHTYRNIQAPSGYSVIELSFDWRCEGETPSYDRMRVYLAPISFTPTTGTQVSASGSAPTGIVQLGGEFNDQGSYSNESFLLDPSYEGQSFRVIFEWRNDGSSGTQPPAAIDNIMIDIATCGPPSNLSVSNETNSTADIDWDAFASEAGWNVQFGPSGFAIGSGTTWNVTAASDTTLDNLTQNTEYDVYVQSDCGSNDTTIWIGPITFTTEPDCPAPTAFQITGSTATSVDLSFVDMAGVSSWNVEYGPAGFTPGTGAATVENVTTQTPTINGLQPGIVYEFYVEADCSSDNPFAGPVTYATPINNDDACDAVSVPVDGSTTQYTNEGATLETGELTTNGDNTVWFTFTAPADGHVEIRTCGNDFDNFIEVYEEPSDCGDFNTFTLVDEATDNPFATCSGTNDPAGLILCGLNPGNTYYLAVGSESAGNTGIFPLTLTAIPNAEAGTATVAQACSGDMVTLSGALSGNDNGGVWSEIDMTGGLEANGVYNTSNLAYIGYDVEYRVTNECSYDSTIVTVAISGPSQAGNDGTMTDCNVDKEYVLITALSGTVDFGGTWVDVDGTGKLNGGIFSPDSLAAGTYQFDYIVSNGVCPNDTSTVEVTITDCLSTEEFDAESFKIFPNPTNGIFYMVSTVNASNAIIEITDLQGKVISSEQMNINIGGQYDFNLSQLERGVYLIKVATQENTTVKRVVLQR